MLQSLVECFTKYKLRKNWLIIDSYISFTIQRYLNHMISYIILDITFIGIIQSLYLELKVYSSGISTSPSSIPCCTSLGLSPFTVHPMELQVPRISLTVPASFLAMERSLMVRAISITWSRVMLPLCTTFFHSIISPDCS